MIIVRVMVTTSACYNQPKPTNHSGYIFNPLWGTSMTAIKISRMNSKLGKILNYSTVPVRDCVRCDSCSADCYALKAYKQYPLVRAAWDGNSTAQKDTETLVTSIVGHIKESKKAPAMFRIHVAGDFTSQENADAWAEIARQCEATTFLAFTKASMFDYRKVPTNMVIIHSQWVGMDKMNQSGINAWIEGDERIPDRHKVCPGSASEGGVKCDACRYCFQKNIKLDVVFKQH